MKIPSGVTVEVSGVNIHASGPKGKASRKFDAAVVNVKIEGDEITVKPSPKKVTRAVSASVNAVQAHIKNLITGVQTGFSKKLTVVFSHFPVTIESKGDTVSVKNYMGEKSPRIAKIVPGTTVVVGKGELTVSGPDREAVGQTAANIIQATNLTKRDRRVFQDGIYHAIE